MSLTGIDVSNNNGIPTVSAALAAATAAFVIVKASEGEHTADADHDAFVAIARKAGKKVGHYHFGHPTQDPVKEADFFLSKAQAKPGDLLALDLEASEGSQAQRMSYALKFLARIKAKTGVKALVYSYTSYLNALIAASAQADVNTLRSYPLWIADPNHAAGKPSIAGWTSWTIHQYAISGGLDRNLFAGDAAAWAKLAVPSPVAPKPTPVPKPTPAPAPAPKPTTGTPQWLTLLNHVMSVPEKVYETWQSAVGWNNDNPWGRAFGENKVPWCVIWDWCMYNEVGLSGIVPKVDNVIVFTNWAKSHGQWSEYPSIGAWVNLGNGHTEVVVGFDADNVFTKGGNSVKAGSTDAGQGNGVWSHSTPRRSPRVIGYFAPRFADGVCPPTADPKDPRGGKAVTSYRWSAPVVPKPTPKPTPAPKPKPKPKPVVDLSNIIAARKKDLPAATGHKTFPADVKIVENALHAEGFLDAQYVDGSWGTKTDDAYNRFRREVLHLTGSDAAGDPGKTSLTALGRRRGFDVRG
jgi:GH25 family lysozyme M1 (1,4-beta-N-acetylmuramidase)